jgi:hypothetical protein
MTYGPSNSVGIDCEHAPTCAERRASYALNTLTFDASTDTYTVTGAAKLHQRTFVFITSRFQHALNVGASYAHQDADNDDH